MFDIITTIIDLVIAGIGIFFVIVEGRKSRKAKEKEAKEAKLCKELAQKASNIQGLIELIDKTAAKITAIYDNEEDLNDIDLLKLTDLVLQIKLIKQSGVDVTKEITDIYYKLLKNEKLFSMSIGFDRTINMCRPIVYEFPQLFDSLMKDVDLTAAISEHLSYSQLLAICEKDSGLLVSNIKSELKGFYLNAACLSKINKMLKETIPYIKEIEIKFSEEI